MHVVVAGGGVAGLEAVLALTDIVGTHVRITLVAPDDDFVYRPLSVGEPFALGQELGIAGIKGFAGGFEHAQLQRFGEGVMKQFVDACIAEELKLENALFQLRTRARVALLHYSPCRPTLEGEPLEIYPFLGATRLSGPLDQLRPALAIHGHAHRGNLRGATRGGVPVYNVALPVLRRLEKPVGFLTLEV